jgi:hypothetical protein
VSLESLFELFVDGVDLVYDLLRVPINGLFALDELQLSPSLECRVSDELAVGPNCVSDRPDEVRYVMCRSIVCRNNVFRCSVMLLRGVWFVVF